MANLSLLRGECRDDFLPPLCMVCGEPCGDLEPVPKRFAWIQGWIVLILFLLIGILGILISMLLRKKRTVDIPLCEDHRNYFKLRLLMNLGLVAAIFGTIAACITLAQLNAPAPMYFVVMGIFLVMLIVAAVVSQKTLRATKIDDQVIVLTNVSRRFRDEVKLLQDAEDEEYERRREQKRLQRAGGEERDEGES